MKTLSSMYFLHYAEPPDDAESREFTRRVLPDKDDPSTKSHKESVDRGAKGPGSR